MRKIIALLSLTALVVMTFGPVLAVGDGTATTGLIKGTAGGTAPIIKAKWEMWDIGKDDSTDPGAQFFAPGVWDAKLNYKVCAIATDPNGAADILGVYAEIFYPISKAIHDLVPSTDIHRDTNNGTKDVGKDGCGVFIEQNTLVKLDKTVGYNLFCDSIKNYNTNLPKFYGSYTYSEICATDGELMKEEAFVWCDNKTLKWEDPAGLYKVVVYAQDKAGNFSNYLENYFEYLPLTAFAKDFTNVDYGEVLLSTPKKISGDINFGTALNPTIRNTGNTRLWMKAAQDDMGLGQSSGVWNVKYDARVGNHELDWTIYDPFGFKGVTPVSTDYIQLEDILDLSETEEMDFSVRVTKWLAPSSYIGTIWLAANAAPFRICP